MISRRRCLSSSAATLLALACDVRAQGAASAPVAKSSVAPVPVPAAASAPAAARPPIFVLNSLDATISVIDPVTMTELRRLPTGKEPHHLYLSPGEKRNW